jgi:hypothetical protein
MSLKNSNDTIGNRTRDLPVSSVVLCFYSKQCILSTPVTLILVAMVMLCAVCELYVIDTRFASQG